MVVLGEKISQMQSLSTLDGTENVPVQKGGNNYKAPMSLIMGSVSLKVKKTYASVSAMNSDNSPVGNDGQPLNAGDIVSIYNPSDAADPDNNSIYTYMKPGWTQSGKLSQVDSELSETSVNPVENKVVAKNMKNARYNASTFQMLEGWGTIFDGTGGCVFDTISLEQDGDYVEFVVTARTGIGSKIYSFTGKKEVAWGGFGLGNGMLTMRADDGQFIISNLEGVAVNYDVKTKIKAEVSSGNYNVYIDGSLKRTVPFSKMSFNCMGNAYPSCGYWIGIVHSIKTSQKGIVAEYTTVDQLPGFINSDGEGAKMWRLNESFLNDAENGYLSNMKGVALQMNVVGNMTYIDKDRKEFVLDTVGDYVELLVANPIGGEMDSNNIQMAGGSAFRLGYFNNKLYFGNNQQSGSYITWDLPEGFDKSKFHTLRIVRADSTNMELFIDGVSMGSQPKQTGNDYCIGFVGSIVVGTVEYDYVYVLVHSQTSGDIYSNALTLYRNASAPNGNPKFVIYDDDDDEVKKRVSALEEYMENAKAKFDSINKGFEGNFYSEYNKGAETNSKTLFADELNISEVGDYVEVMARYTGDTRTFEDKLQILSGCRFGWYTLDQFWIRKSTTYVQWNGLDVDISVWNKIRLEVVEGGWELFINDASQGVKAMPESGGLTFTGVCASGESPQKYDIKYFKLSNGSGETYISPLAFYEGSQNVGLNIDEANDDVVTPVCMVKFVKDEAITSSTRSYFDVAMQDPQNATKYYIIRVVNMNTVGMSTDPIIYTNQWRIGNGWVGQYNPRTGLMTYGAEIITGGESECTWHEKESSNVVDFTGGVHGDERIDVDENSFVKFFINGVEVDSSFMEETSDWIPCSEFSYLQRSTMHQTAKTESDYDTGLDATSGNGVLTIDSESHHFLIDGVDTGIVAYNATGFLSSIGDLTTSKTEENTWAISEVVVLSDHSVVCDHWKHTIIKNCGYTTNNTLSFRKIVEMYWFGGIVCVGKDASKYGYNDKYEIVEFKGDHSTPAGTAGTGDKNYWAWHPSNKLSAHVVSDLTAGGNDNQCYMFVWDEAVYSKYYRRFPSSGGYHTTVVGDKLKASTSVSFNSKD